MKKIIHPELGKIVRTWLAAVVILSVSLGFAAEPPPLPSLTGGITNPRLPGKFVWADLVTDDVAAAQKFYGKMFGWTFQKYGDYIVAKNDDRPLGGIFYRPRPADKSAKPQWFGYLSVSNVKRVMKTVTAAGGRVIAAPKNIPDRGEQAVFADSEGALFGVIKSSDGDPEDFLADPGDWIWIQLLSRDGQKAAEFYRAVGGYDIVENTETNRVNDYVLASEGYARATVRTIPAANTETRPTWLPFVRVKNVAESAALAKQLGGKVLIEPNPRLLGGKVAVIADPAGAAIGIMEWSADLLNGGK